MLNSINLPLFIIALYLLYFCNSKLINNESTIVNSDQIFDSVVRNDRNNNFDNEKIQKTNFDSNLSGNVNDSNNDHNNNGNSNDHDVNDDDDDDGDDGSKTDIKFDFIGFEKIKSIPITFPQDICVFYVNNVKYAASLYKSVDNEKRFAIFKNEDNEYKKIFTIPTPLALSMDCLSFEQQHKAFIALVYNQTTSTQLTQIINGSPIYLIENNEISAVQFFTVPYLDSMKLRSHDNEIFLLQIFKNHNLSKFSNQEQQTLTKCPIYKWFNYHFNIIDYIPCRNAKVMEFFTIGSERFIVVVNGDDVGGDRMNPTINNYRTEQNIIDTEIYKYDYNNQKYYIYEKLKLSASNLNMIDIKYFEIENFNREIQHFIIFVNVFDNNDDLRTNTATSIVYKYSNREFHPFQKFHFNSVQEIHPIQVDLGKFIMLIAFDYQNTKYLEYDDWKFKESNVKYSDTAFSKGIKKLRTFQDFNETFIVVSNENSFINETNIYKPLFKRIDHDVKLTKTKIMNWIRSTYERVSKFDVNELKNKIQDMIASKKQLEKSKNDNLSKQFVKIKQVVTNMLIYPEKNFNKDYWKTLKLLQKALILLENKFNRFKIKQLSKKLNKNDEIFARISTIDTIDVNSNNNNKSETKIFNENDEINKKSFKSLSLFENDSDSKDVIFVDTLTITDKLDYKIINNQSKTELKFKSLNVDQLTINVNTAELEYFNLNFDKINAKNLQLTHKLNGINFEKFNKNLLKKYHNQTIRSTLNIDKLETNNLNNKALINDLNVNKLVKINDKNFNYVINQDIQFAENIYVNNLTVNERINNIYVVNDKLDVLLTNSDQIQIINGFKNFESVQLLEPVTVGGKIFGPYIDKKNPLQTINDDINLNGDYVINGNVLIRKSLTTNNILPYTTNSIENKKSIKNLFQNGLKINESIMITDKQIQFHEKISTKNLNVSYINGIDTRMFVKMNTNEIQIINGTKIFKYNLTIDKGNIEVKRLNDINVDELYDSILRKTGNQNITGEIHFEKIITDRINSDSTFIGNTTIDDIVSTEKSQTIHGDVIIDYLITDNIHINHLTTIKKIYGNYLENFLNNLTKINENLLVNDEILIQKNFNIKNLIIKKQINNETIENIENLLKLLNHDIVFNETTTTMVHFNTNSIHTSNLTFYGKFNGIPYNEFGKNWFLSETDQEFTMPQTFTNIDCDENFTVLGKFNDAYTFDDFITNTYWINRQEYIDNMIIAEEIIIPNDSTITIDRTINNINFTNDVLLTKGVEFQKIDADVLCKNNINIINGQIKIGSLLNKINITSTMELLDGNLSKIIVKNAIFEKLPNFQKLNSIDIHILNNDIWFKNQPIVLDGNLSFFNVLFDKNKITSQGILNDVNLINFKNAYFSKSKPQIINNIVKFRNVILKGNSFIKKAIMKGNITDLVSKSSINFDEFVSKILTKSGTQTITGLWNIFEIHVVGGNLKNVKINNLNLINDVLRYDNPLHLNSITGTKYIKNSNINRLFCESNCYINDVDMNEWIKRTVFIYENFTIQGDIKIDSLFVYDDINVIGYVNNITINENTLLLKNKLNKQKQQYQQIMGNLQIVTKYSKTNKILPLSIQNLYTVFINDIDINKFFANLIDLNRFVNNNYVNVYNGNELNLNSSLEFLSSLNVKNLYVNNRLFNYDLNNITDDNMKFDKITNKIENLINRIEMMIKNENVDHHQPKYINDVDSDTRKSAETNQIIAGKIKSIVSFSSSSSDVIAVLNEDHRSKIDFYEWNDKEQKYIKQKEWHQNEQITDISVASIGNIDLLIVETFKNKTFIQNFMYGNIRNLKHGFQLISNSSSSYIIPLQIENQTHIAFYTASQPAIIYVHRVAIAENGKINLEKIYDLPQSSSTIVKQIISPLNSNILFVLLENGIEIWNIKLNTKLPIQFISISNPIYISCMIFDKSIYLAININDSSTIAGITDTAAVTNNGLIALYKSSDSTFSEFHFYQSIQIENIKQKIYFDIIECETNDLFLYVVTNHRILNVYQYNGISKFQMYTKIEFETIIKDVNLIKMKNLKRNIIAVTFKNNVVLMKIIFK